VICAVYLVANLAILAIEYFSEMSKISRGFFSDTFSPFAYTNLLTFPASVVHSDWPGYPDAFIPERFRHLVRAEVVPSLINIVVEAVLLAAVALLITLLWRWLRRPHS
jgi:hypothetical protein